VVYAMHNLRVNEVTCLGRMEPLAAVTIPVLVWSSERSSVKLSRIHPSDVHLMQGIPDMADLPIGFRALWVHTGYLYVAGARLTGDAMLSQTCDPPEVLAARGLCRFLAAAPLCYEELRLVPVAGYSLTIETAWLSLQDNEGYGVDHDFGNLQALAAALRRVADIHGQL